MSPMKQSAGRYATAGGRGPLSISSLGMGLRWRVRRHGARIEPHRTRQDRGRPWIRGGRVRPMRTARGPVTWNQPLSGATSWTSRRASGGPGTAPDRRPGADGRKRIPISTASPAPKERSSPLGGPPARPPGMPPLPRPPRPPSGQARRGPGSHPVGAVANRSHRPEARCAVPAAPSAR